MTRVRLFSSPFTRLLCAGLLAFQGAVPARGSLSGSPVPSSLEGSSKSPLALESGFEKKLREADFVFLEKILPPSNPEKGTLFHIKDIHGSPEAQAKVARILQELKSQKTIGKVFLEGLSERMDFSGLANKHFPGEWENQVMTFLKEGKISGPVFLSLFFPSGHIHYEGLESRLTYLLNIQAMRDAVDALPGFEKRLQPVQDWLEVQRKEYLPPDLFLLEKAYRQYKTGDLPLATLALLLQKKKADLSEPVTHFLSLLLHPPRVNPQAWANEISKLNSSDGMSSSSKDPSSLFLEPASSAEEKIEALLRLAARSGFSETDFPALLEMKRYFAKTKNLTQTLAGKLEEDVLTYLFESAETVEGKATLLQSMDVTRLSLVSRLKMSPDDIAEIESVLNPRINFISPDVSSLQDEINALKKEALPFLRFYRLAQRRDRAFEERLHRNISNKDQNITVVAGGFHGPGLEKAAKELGLGYVSLVPNLSSKEIKRVGRKDAWSSFLWAKDQDQETLAPAPLSREAVEGMDRILPGGWDPFEGSRNLGAMERSDSPKVRIEKFHISSNDGSASSEVSGEKEARVEFIYSSFPNLRKFFPQMVPDAVRFTGRTLTLNQMVSATIVPRNDKKGIRFIKKTSAGIVEIPAILENVLAGRKRYNGLGVDGHEILTVEHLMAALEVLGILDAEIFVTGDELPILDGSSFPWFMALHWLKFKAEGRDWFRRVLARYFGWWDPKNDFEPPVPFPVLAPVGFVRDRSTSVVILPPDPGFDGMEILAVPNLPTLHEKGFPYETSFSFKWDEEKFQEKFEKAISRHPTFVEADLDELREKGYFQGAVVEGPDKNVVQAHKEGEATSESLSGHKVLDFIGDLSLLHQSLRQQMGLNLKLSGVVAAIGAGHRDHNIWAQVLSRFHFQDANDPPFPYGTLDSSLQIQKREGKLSEKLYQRIKGEVDKQFRRLLRNERADVGRKDPVIPEDAEVLFHSNLTEWKVPWLLAGEEEETWSPTQENLENIVRSFLGLNDADKKGRPVRLILDQLFPDTPHVILKKLDVWVWDEAIREVLIRVRLELEDLEGRPFFKEIGLVVGKYRGDKRTLTKRDLLRELRKNLEMLSSGPGGEDPSSAVLPPNVSLFNMVSLPLKGAKQAEEGKPDEIDLNGVGVFAREWAEENGGYGTSYRLSELMAGKGEGPLVFGLVSSPWGERNFTPMDKQQHQNFAYEFGAQMTRMFLVLFQKGEKKFSGESGFIPGDIGYQGDWVAHSPHPIPGSGKGPHFSLRGVKNYRRATLEGFLFYLLHENVRVFFEEKGILKWREWSVFARLDDDGNPDPSYFHSVLEGMESELEAQYGEEAGAREALKIYDAYLSAEGAAPARAPLHPRSETFFQSFVLRQFVVTDRERLHGRPDPEKSAILGPSLKEIIESRKSVLAKRIPRLEKHGVENLYSPPGSAEWVAQTGKALFGGKIESWVEQAIWTEAALPILFTTFSAFLSHSGAEGMIWLAGAGILTAVWIFSHGKIFSWELGRFIHPSEIKDPGEKELFLQARRQVWLAGALVALMPYAGFYFGSKAGIAALILSVVFHGNMQRKSRGEKSLFWQNLWRGKSSPLKSV